MDLPQALVADQPACLGRLHMVVQEAEGWPEDAAVDELHDRVQLLELVLQRRSSQNERVAALQLLDRARRFRRPVPDALGFVQNDQVGAKVPDQLHVVPNQFVVDQVEEGGTGIELLPPRSPAVDHLDREIAEALDFGLPLVLDGGRRDD